MSSSSTDEDRITEYGDLMRWVVIVLASVLGLWGFVRFNFFGHGSAGDGVGFWLGFNALLYRRKWRRAAGLSLWPRWSKAKV